MLMRKRRIEEEVENQIEDQATNNEYEYREGSSVVYFNGTRSVHLVTLLPLSEVSINTDSGRKTRSTVAYRVFREAAAYLALKHFNQRSGEVLQQLPELIGDCDVQMTLQMRDTQFNMRNAVLQLLESYKRYPEHSLEHPIPFALHGGALSSVSKTLAMLGAVYELPQISATSTSGELDNKELFPYFTRTVPTNAGDSKALAAYFQSLDVSFFGVIYVRDSFGLAFYEDLTKEASARNIKVMAASYNDGDDSTISQAVKHLQETGVKYIVGILNPRTWKTVIRDSINQGIIGTEGYTWFLTEANEDLAQDDFRLDKAQDGDIARAIHGTGVVLLDIPTNRNLNASLVKFETDQSLQQEFISHHAEPEIFQNLSWSYPGASSTHGQHYDAVIALGLAACNAQSRFFTGAELHESLLATQFSGASGYVSFNGETGTRESGTLQYHIENVLLDDNTTTDNSQCDFSSEAAVQIDFSADPIVHETKPYVYFGDCNTPPLDLPRVAVELNLIPAGARAVGLLLGSLVMAMVLFWLIWTIAFRKTDIVRISQPIFLSQLCVGTFVIAMSVIPMSLQEPLHGNILDFACMATPWLQSIGFVTAFSALFSKTWRLNKLFGHGRGFRRIEVKARDVMLPFVVLLILNVGLLIIWSLVAPLRWKRVEVENYDAFGRTTESYGTCQSDYSASVAVQRACLICLVLVNLAALVFANYQCYKARELPTDFNESLYIALSNASLLEAFILGGPILLVVGENPTSNYIVRSLMVFIVCLTITLPIFVPKYLQKKIRMHRRAAGMESRVSVAANNSTRGSGADKSHSRDISGSQRGSTSRIPAPLYVENEDDEAESGSGNQSLKAGTTGIVRNGDYYVQRMNSSGTFGSIGSSLRAVRKRRPSGINLSFKRENSASISSQSRESSSSALHASGDLQNSGDLDELNNASFVSELRGQFKMYRPNVISRVSEGEESLAAASSTRSLVTLSSRLEQLKDGSTRSIVND